MQRAQLGGVLLLARLAWQPTGLRINMMPIVIGDVTTLPRECWPYLPLLRMCPVSTEEWGPFPFPAALPPAARPSSHRGRTPVPCAFRAVCVGARRVAGKVGYLTIDESVVEEGASQRRGGLHTDSPGGLGTAGIVGGATAQRPSECGNFRTRSTRVKNANQGVRRVRIKGCEECGPQEVQHEAVSLQVADATEGRSS